MPEIPTPGQGVPVRQADEYDLKDVGGPFSAAMAVDWLAHVPYSRISSFLEGVNSVLNSDARVVFCDQLPRPGPGKANTMQTAI